MDNVAIMWMDDTGQRLNHRLKTSKAIHARVLKNSVAGRVALS